jgi:hypothetical protein
MLQESNANTVKQVGANGQVSLGKKYANKQIQISKLDDSTLIIKLGRFIPDSEKWLYQGDNLEKLKEAIEWATTHERRDNFEEIKKLILESSNND